MSLSIFPRVRRGALLLDREIPGWWKRVDPSRVDCWNPSACILAMVCGDYEAGKRRLALSHVAAIACGFCAHACLLAPGNPDPEGEYAALSLAWAEEVRDRQRQTSEVASA